MSWISNFIKKNGGDLLTGGLSSVASMATGLLSNSINVSQQRKMQSEQNAFNAQQAQISREWNEQMDNSKYQRQIADMQQAGVNPALAMNGGVSTQATSNATASAANVQAPRVDLTSAVQMAMQSQQLRMQRDLVDSQVKKNEAEANKTNVETEWYGKLSDAQIQKLSADAQKALSDINVNDSTIEVNGKRIQLFDTEMDKNQKESALKVAQTSLANLDAERLRKIMPYVQAYEEAQIAYTTAKTDESRQAAIESYTRASKNLTDEALSQNIIDSELYNNLSDKYGQETKTEEWRTNQARRDYKWTPVMNSSKIVCDGVNAAAHMVQAVNPISKK